MVFQIEENLTGIKIRNFIKKIGIFEFVNLAFKYMVHVHVVGTL